MPDEWIKAKLEAIYDRTELTHRLVEQRLDTIQTQVSKNEAKLETHGTRIEKLRLADAAVSGRGSGRLSAWGTFDRLLTLALAATAVAIAVGSCFLS